MSCTKENALDCFTSTGPTITEERILGKFNQVEMYNDVNLTVFKGSEFKVRVTAGKHLIKSITTEIIDNVLVIENRNRCNFVRGYKHSFNIEVTLPYLQKASNQGVATLKFAEDFTQDTLVVRNGGAGDTYINGTYNQVRTSTHGNGDFYVRGKANSFYVYTNGTNFVRAEEFKVRDYTFVETVTIGDCYINANGLNKFDYHIESSGNIYYSGDPASINNVSSGNESGKAIKLY